MHCANCGKIIPEEAHFCNHCGAQVSSPAGAVTDSSSTSPSDRETLLRTAIGPKNTDYYLERFRKFETGKSSVSWNWPAFFISFYWLLYRKMWLYAAAYLFVPTFIYLLGFFVAAAFTTEDTAALIGIVANLVAIFVIFPMFANRLYYRVLSNRITKAERHEESDQRMLWLARKGGTTNAVWIVLLIVVVGGGILAAIAIPAYQDYTIRSQVAEGLNLAAAAKAAVADSIFATGQVPATRLDAGMTANPSDTSGRYVRAVDVVNGRIDIVYGAAAHSLLTGETLSVTPYAAQLSEDNWQIVWRCGSAPVPPEATHEIAPYTAGSLASLPHYLPSACRP
ncbi:pilin [Lentisalinibacter salinarum]|uniref:pilin n=1 Tax=Lentisalinibacter salinarum TaxID=2992239 RepID=UPI003870B59B